MPLKWPEWRNLSCISSQMAETPLLLVEVSIVTGPQAFLSLPSEAEGKGMPRTTSYPYLFPVTYVRRIVDYMTSIGYGSLATLMGRYYAMDRDKR